MGRQADGQELAGQIPMTENGDLAAFVIAQEGDDVSVFWNADDATRVIEAEDALSGALEFSTGEGTTLRPIRDATSRYGWRLEVGRDNVIDFKRALHAYASGIEAVGTRASGLSTQELLQLVARLQDQGRAHRKEPERG